MSKGKTREPAGTCADRSAINRSASLVEHYGCGPVKFTGTSDALYERHLLFDAVKAPSAAGARERFDRTVAEYAADVWNVKACPVR